MENFYGLSSFSCYFSAVVTMAVVAITAVDVTINGSIKD